MMRRSGSSTGTQKKLPRTTGWTKSLFAVMGSLFKEVNERYEDLLSDSRT